MKELKCPKCGNVFSVDEADYVFIANQVKNAEFDAEVSRRMEELHKQHLAEQKAEESKLDKILVESNLKHQEELNKREQALRNKESELETLRQKIENQERVKELELAAAVADKEKTIGDLQAKLNQSATQQKMAVIEEQNKAQAALSEKDIEIERLKREVQSKENETVTQLAFQKEQYDGKLKMMQTQVDYYKDLKARMSTKMVGETLEIHCSTEFNRVRPLFPNAYFEKDNDISGEGNTKGDFIFRDYDDGIEYVSIMFEMKNEMDETATKHTNESFLKKLDADRKVKNCEYAVLVSLLEPDSELYNTGIVDMSHRYPKMYVIRPQFFIPLITLLVQTSRKSIEYKKQLAIAQNQSIDVTNFEQRLLEFKDKFGRNYRLASEKFQKAIDEIDKSIDHLNKIKDALVGAENNLRLANDKAEDLSIKKLTRGNKTMKDMFDKLPPAEDADVVTDPFV
ncbi:MAG: DUF2130 domain-containing protein [Bacteroidales bacterium]|nr:DUF2130 domain-containing protein [Bacteroidales bacterium]